MKITFYSVLSFFFLTHMLLLLILDNINGYFIGLFLVIFICFIRGKYGNGNADLRDLCENFVICWWWINNNDKY